MEDVPHTFPPLAYRTSGGASFLNPQRNRGKREWGRWRGREREEGMGGNSVSFAVFQRLSVLIGEGGKEVEG